VLFADLNNYPLTILLFIWLFGTMMWCAFGAVRHADAVAVRLGEPYGTLVLTLSVIVIEVSLLAAIIILFYLVFVVIQTMRHRAFFAEPKRNGRHARHQGLHHGSPNGSLAYHVLMLVLTLLPVVLLSEFLAIIVDFGIEDLGLPAPLGGLMIAILVLSPEGLTAFHAALANQLQRAVNVCLGSALATIGLTIPAVLTIGLITGYEVHLGLDEVQTVLLILTLFVSALTFGGARTNVLQGIVHLLLFIVYLAPQPFTRRGSWP
jgi:Ca2+:H+ antiporter